MNWRPETKPRQGIEIARLRKISDKIAEVANIHHRPDESAAAYKERSNAIFKEIDTLGKLKQALTVPLGETVEAPRIGINPEATAHLKNEWMRRCLPNRHEHIYPFYEVMRRHYGEYVYQLAKRQDGLGMVSTISRHTDFNRSRMVSHVHDIDLQDAIDRANYIPASGAQELIQRIENYAMAIPGLVVRRLERCTDNAYINGYEEGPVANAYYLLRGVRWLRFWTERGHAIGT